MNSNGKNYPKEVLGGLGRNPVTDTRSAVVNMQVMGVDWRWDRISLDYSPPLHEVSFRTTPH